MAEPLVDAEDAPEYREPDASYGMQGTARAGDLICNNCHEVLYISDDRWGCSCGSAYFEYARPKAEDDD